MIISAWWCVCVGCFSQITAEILSIFAKQCLYFPPQPLWNFVLKCFCTDILIADVTKIPHLPSTLDISFNGSEYPFSAIYKRRANELLKLLLSRGFPKNKLYSLVVSFVQCDDLSWCPVVTMYLRSIYLLSTVCTGRRSTVLVDNTEPPAIEHILSISANDTSKSGTFSNKKHL